MKILDGKGRIFGKVSLVDIFAVVVVAAVIIVVYFNLGRGHLAIGTEQPVLITFFHPALEDFTVNAVRYGAPIMDDGNGTFMGTVYRIEIGESVSIMPDIHGIERASPMAGYSSIAITGRVYAGMSDGAVVLGGNVYGVGEEVIIWAGDAKAMIHISAIRAEGA